MSEVEVVVARYCEDLGWLSRLPTDWQVTVYDKSQGGPRQGLSTEMYKSPNGPDSAELVPGSIPLINVGCEAHSYLHHISERYSSLADTTLFLQGGPHFPELVPFGLKRMIDNAVRYDFASSGGLISCDADGFPHHNVQLLELRQMWGKFFSTEILPTLDWWPAAQFAVKKEVLRQVPQRWWAEARNTCTTKLHACAMERLWYEIFRTVRE